MLNLILKMKITIMLQKPNEHLMAIIQNLKVMVINAIIYYKLNTLMKLDDNPV